MAADDLESLHETLAWLSKPGTREAVAAAEREYAAGETTSGEDLRAERAAAAVSDRRHRTMKTTVRKTKAGRWRVTYVLPYSGLLEVDWDTWREALDYTDVVEEARLWM